MNCSFCCDDLENHTHNFLSDYESTELDGTPVAICGTCVLFFEMKIRISQQVARLEDYRLSMRDPIERWEDDGGPPTDERERWVS